MIVLALSLMLTAGAPTDLQRPDWIAMPTNTDMLNWMPDRAKDDNIGGSASVDCEVAADGTLDKCTIVDEQPKGYGFGKAALKLARKFKMKPTSLDGTTTAGSHVTVPLQWARPRY